VSKVAPIDSGTEFGRHVLERLRDDEVVWLTTVAADGTPQPNPVWFFWDGEAIVVYSQPNAAKLRNLARNPRVSVNFEVGPSQEDIVVVTGVARVTPDVASHDSRYVEKYAAGIEEIGFDREGYAARFSVELRVTPEKARGLAPL
jgi:PPOX class probable F420-dependent enzyme